MYYLNAQHGTLFRIHDLPLYALTSLPPWRSTECCELVTNQIAPPKSLDALTRRVPLEGYILRRQALRDASHDALPVRFVGGADMHSSDESIGDSKVIVLLPR